MSTKDFRTLFRATLDCQLDLSSIEKDLDHTVHTVTYLMFLSLGSGYLLVEKFTNNYITSATLAEIVS